MYIPRYKHKSNKVPILSKNDIDFFAEAYVKDFQPEALVTPMEFNIDLFVEEYLELVVDYQYLSCDLRYLGMTIFNDTHKVIIFDPARNQADYISANAGTVIIDNSLLQDSQEHRYRYTMAHESAHWIFHKAYFGYDPNQLSLFDLDVPFIQCRDINKDYYHIRDTKNWDDHKWMEWHADKFASAILMPKSSIEIFIQSNPSLNTPNAIISGVVYKYTVSAEAATYRLSDLGIIKRKINNTYEQLSLV